MNITGTAAFMLAIFLGAATQRLTGLGFALVATPLLVYALGPWDAVGFLIVAGSFSAAGTLWLARHDVDWRRAGVLAGTGLIGAIPGTWILHTTPRRTIELVIGAFLLIALAVTALVPRGVLRDTTALGAATGFASGFASAAVALGGVPLVAYARLSNWHPTLFAATIQPVFVGLVVPLVVLRALVGSQPLPALSVLELGLAVAMLLIGLWAGHVLSRHLTSNTALRLVTAVAFAGAITTITRAALPS